MNVSHGKLPGAEDFREERIAGPDLRRDQAEKGGKLRIAPSVGVDQKRNPLVVLVGGERRHGKVGAGDAEGPLGANEGLDGVEDRVEVADVLVFSDPLPWVVEPDEDRTQFGPQALE